MKRISLLIIAAAFTGFFSWTVVTYGSDPGWKVWPWWDQAVLGGLIALFLIVRVLSKGAR